MPIYFQAIFYQFFVSFWLFLAQCHPWPLEMYKSSYIYFQCPLNETQLFLWFLLINEILNVFVFCFVCFEGVFWHVKSDTRHVTPHIYICIYLFNKQIFSLTSLIHAQIKLSLLKVYCTPLCAAHGLKPVYRCCRWHIMMLCWWGDLDGPSAWIVNNLFYEHSCNNLSVSWRDRKM